MKADIDEMAEYFSRVSLDLVDAYKTVIKPGNKQLGTYTAPASGLVFPLRGRARMTFDGVSYEMGPGRVFHAGPGMTLDKEVVGESEWEFILIHYQISDSDRHAFPYASSHYELEPGYNPQINEMLQRLYKTCAMPGSLQALRAKSLFFTIMDAVLNCYGERRSQSGRELVEQAMEYMNAHYMEQLTIPKLAEQHGLGSKRFAYLFQKHGGMSPNEYLIAQRVKQAKELLCTTACSVTEVALCVGYSDPYYFSKLFKKYTGVSPVHYNAALKKNTG
ncbi:Helix-turn-helix, AraC domain-containing protein [uncultured Sporomusa sp.]|uniref:Helix-turn-helix, AraC domain-containing protein n=1 Tax=uncultured Sporomusa sp. TaxID=307249 RepID=A0A212LYV6_9FIRM|nr:AraC family transcriptional regulator [uncultured Sporomusa sp.]SCM82708.1 Helix-turn-helix, AraC domain-containing protein [uncultured Sporomusa sp.]